ncbi:hypothetical protein B0T11DRAFT_64510 [Plectosphaerella cucumerina]|uniref:Uncharacterized protein n=1 Tax=Plectosphaerella cucumerina TaxID=40658 RepID=A0A8K0TLD1_9PEZI|nr:hypothetical protein B0T11DRAFT_64510 [Plectosphaerella cucumerina]
MTLNYGASCGWLHVLGTARAVRFGGQSSNPPGIRTPRPDPPRASPFLLLRWAWLICRLCSVLTGIVRPTYLAYWLRAPTAQRAARTVAYRGTWHPSRNNQVKRSGDPDLRMMRTVDDVNGDVMTSCATVRETLDSERNFKGVVHLIDSRLMVCFSWRLRRLWRLLGWSLG